MSSPAEAVQALYRALGSWQAVADLCQHGRKRRHSAGYYQQVATGRIRNPSKATLAGIARAPALAERLLKRDFSRSARFGLTVEHSIGVEANLWRIAKSLTWDKWAKMADELMRERYG